MANQYGDIFRAERERNGHSLDAVMRATKIRPNIIESIEAGDWNVLPSSYMKSFVRTYGKFLHIDETRVEDMCREHFNARIPSAGNQPMVEQLAVPSSPTMVNGASIRYDAMAAEASTSTPVHPYEQPYIIPSEAAAARASASVINRIVYASLAFALMTIGYYYLVGKRAQSASTISVQQTTGTDTDTSMTPLGNGSVSPSTQDTSAQNFAGQDTLLLEARATDSVWFNIVIDGKKSEQFITQPGKTYKWRGALFALSLGNAGGVELTLNNAKLPPLGKAGVIVRDVKITRDGIKSSNMPSSMKMSFIPANERPTTRESDKVGTATNVANPATIKNTGSVSPSSSAPTNTGSATGNDNSSVAVPRKTNDTPSGTTTKKSSNDNNKPSVNDGNEQQKNPTPTQSRTLRNTRPATMPIQEIRPSVTPPTLQLQSRTRSDSTKGL
jgi:hypothetical protein